MSPVRRRGSRRGPELAPAPGIERVIAGRAWLRNRLQPVEIGLDGEGTIRKIGRDLRGVHRQDFGDRIILPSAVDLHVHFRDPGPPGAPEEFATGSLQAALGGVGLVADMPNTDPPTTSVSRLESKASRARGRLAVDVLLYAAALDPRQVRRVAAIAGGFKLYLTPTTGLEEPPPPEATPAILEAVADTGLALSVHAEDPSSLNATVHPRDPRSWNAARPPEAEAKGVVRLRPFPAALRLHVAHVTSPRIARQLHQEGVSFEVTPHHLLLSETTGTDPHFKVNPPLRSEADRAGLWRAFADGEVPSVASDHAPHSEESKELPFDVAPSGLPGVETMLPLLLSRVRAGELSLGALYRAACDRPALWLGLPQGRLAPGLRANLVIVDFLQRRRIRAIDLHAPCGWTPFENFEGIFPTDHFIDGARIVEDGEYVGTPRGRIVRPEYARIVRKHGF